MDVIDKILELLKEPKKTQAGLARHIGMKAPNLNKLLKRLDNRRLSSEQLFLAAEYFGVDPNFFADSRVRPTKQVPIISTASCGGGDMDYLQESKKAANYNGDYWTEELYCVIANGDSMATEIEDGDEIICDPNAPINNGDIVHYQINGESAVKVYYKDEDNHIIEFIPYNPTPNFKTRVIRLESEEKNDLKIAKVVAINKLKFNNRLARLRIIGRA